MLSESLQESYIYLVLMCISSISPAVAVDTGSDISSAYGM